MLKIRSKQIFDAAGSWRREGWNMPKGSILKYLMINDIYYFLDLELAWILQHRGRKRTEFTKY
jgi:hypothetical protein